MTEDIKDPFPFCIHYPGKHGAKDHLYVAVGEDQLPEYVKVSRGYAGLGTEERRSYLPEVTCTMEPASLFDEDGGIYTCSNCGKAWHFLVGGPRENGWKCCPFCTARIEHAGA